MYNGLASKVYDVMQSYAEQHGYTLVLDISQQQSPGALCRPRRPTSPRSHRRIQPEVGRSRAAAAQPPQPRSKPALEPQDLPRRSSRLQQKPRSGGAYLLPAACTFTAAESGRLPRP